MQGLLDTVEREFRVAGWKSPAAPVTDATREEQKKKQQQQQRQQKPQYSEGGVFTRVAPQHNEDASGNVAGLNQSPKQQGGAGYQSRRVEFRSATSRQSTASGEDETTVPRYSNNEGRSSCGNSSTDSGASPESSVPQRGDGSVAGEQRQGASRKRPRVNSGNENSGPRADPPSPPNRPGVARLASGEHDVGEPIRLNDAAGRGESSPPEYRHVSIVVVSMIAFPIEKQNNSRDGASLFTGTGCGDNYSPHT